MRSAPSRRVSSDSSASSLESIPLGGGLDAGDVVRRLLARPRAQLGGAALGGVEDQADLLGGAVGERGAGRVQLGLELVGDAAQVLVDGRRVVSAATGREVAALDSFPIHDRSG